MGPEQLAAIRAWARLDRARAGLNRHLQRRHGVTSTQLEILGVIADGPVTLAELRERLAMHPATLGQLIDRLERLDLVERRPSLYDLRKRIVEATEAGRALLLAAPAAGPTRLGQVALEPERLRRLAAALDDAVGLLGLEPYAPRPAGPPAASP